jgi:hypothetical protein
VVDIKSTIKSKKQLRKFLMAIFGVADQVPWWVGITDAKGWSSPICCSGWVSPMRSVVAVVGGGGSRRCWGREKRRKRREREKFLGEKMKFLKPP